jgi:hypothetical protein
MSFDPNQSDSSHRRHTNGNTLSRISHRSELDLVYDELQQHSIFVTDSSKVFEINEQDRRTKSKNSG